MAIYASFHARGTQRVDVVSMGVISAPQPSLAPGQLYIASGPRTTSGRPQPMAVQSSTRVPSGQRT